MRLVAADAGDDQQMDVLSGGGRGERASDERARPEGSADVSSAV